MPVSQPVCQPVSACRNMLHVMEIFFFTLLAPNGIEASAEAEGRTQVPPFETKLCITRPDDIYYFYRPLHISKRRTDRSELERERETIVQKRTCCVGD